MKQRPTIIFLSLLLSTAILFSQPERAGAGVLTGGGNIGVSVGTPRIRFRTILKSTAAERNTMPEMKFHGEPLGKIIARAQRVDYRYQQALYRWELKRLRTEARYQREEDRRKAREKRESDKRRAQQLRKQGLHGTSGGTDLSISRDPREWFTKQIAQVEQGGSLSVHRPSPSKPDAGNATGKGASDAGGKLLDKRGTEITPQAGKKPVGFWTHIWRALGIS